MDHAARASPRESRRDDLGRASACHGRNPAVVTLGAICLLGISIALAVALSQGDIDIFHLLLH